MLQQSLRLQFSPRRSRSSAKSISTKDTDHGQSWEESWEASWAHHHHCNQAAYRFYMANSQKRLAGEPQGMHILSGHSRFPAWHSCFRKETWNTGKLSIITAMGLSHKSWGLWDAEMEPRAIAALQNMGAFACTHFGLRNNSLALNTKGRASGGQAIPKPFSSRNASGCYQSQNLIPVPIHQERSHQTNALCPHSRLFLHSTTSYFQTYLKNCEN